MDSVGNRKFTKIRAYYLPNDETKLTTGYPCTFEPIPSKTTYPLQAVQLDDDSSSMEHLLSSQTPVYEKTWPVLNPFNNETITCDLPGVVANVFTVELIGKHVEQTPGSGYYACVEILDCKGIPLHADASGVGRHARE